MLRWADLLVEELVRCGVEAFFVAPGSRSTPLVMAIAANPEAKAWVHYDERGGAFAALGYGRATGRPSAWVTTSGTAVANAWPAVAEAAAARIPLLLLTADRPPELRDTGANQSIDQVKLFGSAVRWSVDLPVPDPSIDPAYVLTTVNQAVYRTRRAPRGPVHLNLMFREPLVPDDNHPEVSEERDHLNRWQQREAPYTRYYAPPALPDAAALDEVARVLSTYRRGLVMAGHLHEKRDGESAKSLAEALGWPLVADINAQLRLGVGEASVPVLTHTDHVYPFLSKADHPNAVIQVGGRPTSKRLAAYLKQSRPDLFLLLDHHPDRYDPNHQVTHRLEAQPSAGVEQLVPLLKSAPDPAWLQRWAGLQTLAETVIEESLSAQTVLTEPGVARLISRLIPESHGLVLASSMPIRDMDMYAVKDGARVPVTANRGASGIDGTVATAAGYARGLGQPVTLLIGDLALLHDLNSLALLQKAPVVVVVVNNDGGGIFSLLPIAAHEAVFEPYFGTPHGLTFAAAADMFGLTYTAPATIVAFEAAYRDACLREGSSLIEVSTNRQENAALHTALVADVADRVGRLAHG